MAVNEPEAVFTVKPIDPAATADGNTPEQERQGQTESGQQSSFPVREDKDPRQTAQDELALREAYFGGLHPAEDTERRQTNETVQPLQPMQFITLEEASKLECADYTIKKLFPAQGVVLLYGEPATGKSFSTFSTCVYISEGWSICGRRVRRRPIYYLSLEGGGGWGKRIKAFNVLAYETGKPKLNGTFNFWLHGFALNKWTECQALCDTIVAAEHFGAVVVIDTLSQATLGLDENSSDMAVAIGNATRIAETIRGLVILVHHVGKVSASGPRGHSSLMGNVDCAVLIRKAASGKGSEWSVTKSKDDAEGQTLAFRLHVKDVGQDADGDTVTSCAAEPYMPERPQGGAVAEVLKPGSEADMCLKTFLLALPDAKDKGVYIDDWRKIYYAKSASEPKSKKAQFDRARKKLVSLGVLVVDSDFYSLTPEFQRRLKADTAAGR